MFHFAILAVAGMNTHAAFPDETARFVADVIALMTREEKFGQLDLFRAADDPDLERLIAAGHLGGVAYGAATQADPGHLQALATASGRGIPLLLSGPGQPSAQSPWAIGASWDAQLARDIGAQAAAATRAAGFNTLAGPRIASSGTAEGADIAASDPTLAAELASAWITGATSHAGMLALAVCDTGDVGVQSVATRLAAIGPHIGIDCPAFGHRRAQQLGFAGIVLRECAAIRALALQAGDGAINDDRLDAAVRGILAAKHAAGLFRPRQHEATEPLREAIPPAHVAQCTMVLLRNEAGLLPLSPVSDRVLVVGPADGAGRGCVDALARAGVGRLAAPGLAMRQSHESWADPHAGDPFALALTRDAARRADFAFVVLDHRHFAPGAANTWPRLTKAASAMLCALSPVGTRLVAILATPTPVDLGEADGCFAGIVHSWDHRPGWDEALGDLLSGRCGPTARLPASAGRYAFGQGLSFGESLFGGLAITTAHDRITITLTVRNAGNFAAYERVQIYRREKSGDPSLITHGEVALKPGHSHTVTFDIDSTLAMEWEAGRYELLVGKDRHRVLNAMVDIDPSLARALMARGPRGVLRRVG